MYINPNNYFIRQMTYFKKVNVEAVNLTLSIQYSLLVYLGLLQY